MKICYIASSESIHVKRWLSYFVKRGHEVHLIFNTPPLWDGIEFHEFNLSIPNYITTFLRRISKFKRLLSDVNPDIVHAHYAAHCGIWGGLSNFSPFVLSVWGCDVLCSRCSYSDCHSRTPKTKFEEILKKFGLARANLLTGNSESVIKAALDLYNDKGNCLKAERISMGVKLDNFNLNIISDIKERLQIGNCPVIISNRRFDPLYNIDIIIEAIPIVLRKVPMAKFVFTEKGPLKEEFEKRVEDLGISNSVRFTGYLNEEDCPKYLSIADIAISIPFSDSSPSSVLEAMACKKAVIISDVDGPKELIRDGWNGFVVPVRDAECLAEKIIILLKNGELRKQFAERSYKVVKEKADYYKHMEKMENLYEELCAQKKKV